MRFLERELGKSSTSHINQPRLLINGEAKMKIRRQLDYLGVNAATLFPDTASRMRYVAEGYRSGIFGRTLYTEFQKGSEEQ